MASNPGILSTHTSSSSLAQIVVGNGAPLALHSTGQASLPTPSAPLLLNNVLISPHLIKNLIFVRALTRDNSVSVEFDPFGFSIKDLRTKTVLLRCDSTGDLYPLRSPASPSPAHGLHHNLHASLNTELWHSRLGHPGDTTLRRILNSFGFSCSKSDKHTSNACRLGKHVRLPFTESNKISSFPFQLLHCDLWTSPVASNSGFQFYLVIFDDYSHFAWTFPLHHKSDVLPTLISFHAFVRTKFRCDIQCFQTDNGKEFDNGRASVFTTHGIAFRLTCPYTSQQNGRAERILRTINDSLRALLFHASLPLSFWPDALSTTTYLLNRRPCRRHDNRTPYELLYGHTVLFPPMIIFGYLVIDATLTLPQQHRINSLYGLSRAFSLGILLSNEATRAMIRPAIASSPRAMFTLTRTCFHLRRSRHHRQGCATRRPRRFKHRRQPLRRVASAHHPHLRPRHCRNFSRKTCHAKHAHRTLSLVMPCIARPRQLPHRVNTNLRRERRQSVP